MVKFTRAAYIASTKSLEGGVVCKSANALPFLLDVGHEVHFVPPSLRGPRSATVERVQQLRCDAWEVYFSGVENVETAEQLVGAYCLVDTGQLPALSLSEAPVRLNGWAVEDARRGSLGGVVDVLENPAQATLVVEGEYGQVLIPLVDEFVLELNEDAQRILVEIPESLLHLNAQREPSPMALQWP